MLLPVLLPRALLTCCGWLLARVSAPRTSAFCAPTATPSPKEREPCAAGCASDPPEAGLGALAECRRGWRDAERWPRKRDWRGTGRWRGARPGSELVGRWRGQGVGCGVAKLAGLGTGRARGDTRRPAEWVPDVSGFAGSQGASPRTRRVWVTCDPQEPGSRSHRSGRRLHPTDSAVFVRSRAREEDAKRVAKKVSFGNTRFILSVFKNTARGVCVVDISRIALFFAALSESCHLGFWLPLE